MEGKAMVRRSLLALGAVLLSVTGASADTEPHLGEIMVFGFNFCPTGWTPANGDLQAISSNIALFSLLGVNYGGNGTQTFGLPKGSVIAAPTGSSPATPMSVCIATGGIFPSRP